MDSGDSLIQRLWLIKVTVRAKHRPLVSVIGQLFKRRQADIYRKRSIGQMGLGAVI